MNLIPLLRKLRRDEHRCTVEIVQTLVRLHASGEHLDNGYSSIFDFLVRGLKYSNAAASRRYKAMKCAQRDPRVIEMLRNHDVSLTTLATAESSLAEKPELLVQVAGKSAAKVEKILAAESLVPRKPRESVKRVAVKVEDPLFASASDPAECRVSLRTTLTESDYEDFEKVRAIVSRKKPGASVEDVLIELMGSYLKQHAPKKRKKRLPQRKSTTRRIPKPVRDEVMLRDGEQCTHVGPDGTRCSAKHNLEIDHIKPWALGGTNEPDNLRVLCKAHNLHRARKTFGEHRVPQRKSGWAEEPNSRLPHRKSESAPRRNTARE